MTGAFEVGIKKLEDFKGAVCKMSISLDVEGSQEHSR